MPGYGPGSTQGNAVGGNQGGGNNGNGGGHPDFGMSGTTMLGRDPAAIHASQGGNAGDGSVLGSALAMDDATMKAMARAFATAQAKKQGTNAEEAINAINNMTVDQIDAYLGNISINQGTVLNDIQSYMSQMAKAVRNNENVLEAQTESLSPEARE